MNTSNSQDRLAALNKDPSAEQSLLACIQEQSTVFNGAVQLIERLEKAANRSELGDPDSIAQLQKSLDRVVYARFTSLKISASPTLRSSLARHEEQLRTLVGRINSLQDVFETIRNNMSPELDTDIRRRSMHSAYQKSLKTV